MSIQTELQRIIKAKSDLKESINSKGGTISDQKIDRYYSFVDSINVGTDVSDTTAKASDVLPTKYFYNSSGEKTYGTISIFGGTTITPDTQNHVVQKNQYLTQNITIIGDQNLVATNIRKGITIFGVLGNYEKQLIGACKILKSSPDTEAVNRIELLGFTGGTSLYDGQYKDYSKYNGVYDIINLNSRAVTGKVTSYSWRTYWKRKYCLQSSNGTITLVSYSLDNSSSPADSISSAVSWYIYDDFSSDPNSPVLRTRDCQSQPADPPSGTWEAINDSLDNGFDITTKIHDTFDLARETRLSVRATQYQEQTQKWTFSTQHFNYRYKTYIDTRSGEVYAISSDNYLIGINPIGYDLGNPKHTQYIVNVAGGTIGSSNGRIYTKSYSDQAICAMLIRSYRGSAYGACAPLLVSKTKNGAYSNWSSTVVKFYYNNSVYYVNAFSGQMQAKNVTSYQNLPIYTIQLASYSYSDQDKIFVGKQFINAYYGLDSYLNGIKTIIYSQNNFHSIASDGIPPGQHSQQQIELTRNESSDIVISGNTYYAWGLIGGEYYAYLPGTDGSTGFAYRPFRYTKTLTLDMNPKPGDDIYQFGSYTVGDTTIFDYLYNANSVSAVSYK